MKINTSHLNDFFIFLFKYRPVFMTKAASNGNKNVGIKKIEKRKNIVLKCPNEFFKLFITWSEELTNQVLGNVSLGF